MQNIEFVFGSISMGLGIGAFVASFPIIHQIRKHRLAIQRAADQIEDGNFLGATATNMERLKCAITGETHPDDEKWSMALSSLVRRLETDKDFIAEEIRDEISA